MAPGSGFAVLGLMWVKKTRVMVICKAITRKVQVI